MPKHEPRDKRDSIHSDCQHAVTITARDRLMQAWEDCMEHSRNYTKYSKLYADTEAGALFADAAVAEGECAARMHDLLLQWQETRAQL